MRSVVYWWARQVSDPLALAQAGIGKSFKAITLFRRGSVTSNEGGKGGTMPWAQNFRGRREVPTMSQVLSSIQYVCFGTTSGSSNMGAPNLLLVPGAIWPRYALVCHTTSIVARTYPTSLLVNILRKMTSLAQVMKCRRDRKLKCGIQSRVDGCRSFSYTTVHWPLARSQEGRMPASNFESEDTEVDLQFRTKIFKRAVKPV